MAEGGAERPFPSNEGFLFAQHRIEPPAPSCCFQSRTSRHTTLTPELPPIGTTIVYRGRAYRFCGVTPASIQPVTAVLRDLRTGAWTQVPVARLAIGPTPQ
jgi:hypothetical protein